MVSGDKRSVVSVITSAYLAGKSRRNATSIVILEATKPTWQTTTSAEASSNIRALAGVLYVAVEAVRLAE